ncbi:putative glycosyltransferase domain-containing protein [Ixodes scapularis]
MPHYKRYGINAGVMLMNLTRMRTSGLDALLLSWMDKYHHKVLDFHDQDIINTVFHHHPEKVFHGPCTWNFVHLVCLSNISCRGETPALVHGTNETFSDPYRVPAYRAIGKAMQQYRLGTSLERGFIDVLEENLRSTKSSVCADKIQGFVVHWRRLARQLDIERGWNTTEAATATS